MRWPSLAVRLILPLLALAGAAAAPAVPIDYEMTPQLGAAGLERIRVTVRFRGDADGETGINLPTRWAGTDALYGAIRDLAVAGGRLADTGDPATRRIAHAPGARIAISYSLGLSPADPNADYEKARPVLRPGWFYVHGEGALIVPAGRGTAPARFRWGPAPRGWRMASNLDGAAITLDDAVQSIFAGGSDFRLAERSVGGRPVRILIRGAWAFADAGLADGLARVIAAENAYMESPAAPFLVTLIPLTGAETGAISFGGTGRAGGFALASTGNVGLDRLLPLLAHEYGHRWFGRALGPVPDPDGPDYWFTEGFNDFVAGQALVRSGFWSARDYADHLDELLLRYASSPARTRGNADLAAHFWDDQAAQQMPYDRGHLFALTLDGAEGHVRRTLLRMLAPSGAFAAAETEAQRFVRAGGASEGQVAAMLAGAPIVLADNLFAPCGAVGWAERPVYATGYTAETRADGRYFSSVVEGSPAWTAGLRPGMRHVRRESFRPGDSSVPMVMRVADASGERVLTWLPQGREIVRFQSLVLAAGAGAGDACRARLGGS
jgi:predicted metalloprotease with PDZ domain